MRILSVHRKLSVIERCAYLRGVRTERFDCEKKLLHYISMPKILFGDKMRKSLFI